jgi:hypothetical protein
VTVTGSAAPASRLRRLAQRPRESAGEPEAQEHCELCGERIAPEHRHLMNLESGELLCACRPCSILFDRNEAGGNHFRLIPQRRARIVDFALDDLAWEELRIPVDMAFFFHSTRAERVIALYPGPMGATESLLGLEAWQAIVAANPLLERLEADVEALLVNRARGSRGYWLVPIDECYALAGLIRTRWRGLTGGREVWEEIERFFESLDRRARHLDRDGNAADANRTEPAVAGGEEG